MARAGESRENVRLLDPIGPIVYPLIKYPFVAGYRQLASCLIFNAEGHYQANTPHSNSLDPRDGLR